MRRRPGRRLVAAVVAAALVVGVGVGAFLYIGGSRPAQGKLLVLLSVELPVPQHPADFQGKVVGLRLEKSGSGPGWTRVPVPPTQLRLPGHWVAPSSQSLFLAAVPAVQYRAAELLIKPERGRELTDSQRVALSVGRKGLTPLLFTLRDRPSGSPSALATATAYGGNQEVNFGLQVASDQVMRLPTLALVDQAGRSLSLSRYRGKIVVLASFLTECQETCPLVAAALLQLQRLLDQKGLQGRVQILEVTQDPADDTPAILTKYQRYFSLPWPLLTGTTANLGQFWSQLKVPPIQNLAWDGPAPIDMFTGQPEPYNITHASVVDVVNSQGYVVAELQDQPTLSLSSIPHLIVRYLDAQGRQEQRQGGSWNPESLLRTITPLLQEGGVYTSLPSSGGVAEVGHPAPAFSLPSTAGGEVALSQELGHPVLIDFWATWCTNCRADMKLVSETASSYRSRGLRVLLVDYQETGATATSFLTKLGITLPTLLDRDGSVAARYGVPGLPVAIFVNPAGAITAIQVGQLDQADLAQDLPTALRS